MRIRYFTAALLLFAAIPFSRTVAVAATAAEVTTIAGSGAAGMRDGKAQSATFLFPVAVAPAKDGSIYISDSAAQRIRLLTPSGIVHTVAGSGSIQSPGLRVAPGYRDGPALSAQFDGPSGIAVGPDGGLYIADSYNSCIRKLLNGQVTTVIGVCGDIGGRAARPVADGPAGTARLAHPSALAFDSNGTLYIADDGGGLRKFANGVLTTIHFQEEPVLPKAEVLSAVGVAVSSGPEPAVAVVTHAYIFIYYPATGRDTIIYPDHPSDDNVFGHPNQVAAIDKTQFVFTDLFSANVRYLRVQVLPFNGSMFTRVVAGGHYERGSDNVGFANGRRTDARFFDPMGVAIVGNTAIVADAGNRRIRKIVLPALRTSEAGFDSINKVDDKHYEVALIGASWSFWDTLGDDSICAHIEKVLNESRRFSKPVRCHTVRIDSGRAWAFEDYIKNVLPYEHFDLVIMDAEAYDYNLPVARNGLNRVQQKLPGTNTTFAAYLRAHFQELLKNLSSMHTRLALLWIYNVQDISNAEWIIQGTGFYRAPPSSNHHEATQEILGVLKGLPLMTYDMYDDIVSYELSSGALQLYQPVDQHPNPRGNAFIGERVARALLSEGLGKRP